MADRPLPGISVAAGPARANVWQQRRATLQAMGLLWRAQFLARYVPMSRWRAGLGEVVEGGIAPTQPASDQEMRVASAHARRIVRAAHRLPREPKCLAQAMALQWLLIRHGLRPQLVLAMDRRDRDAAHGYHAWVELGGQMLIGQCQRGDYHPIVAFVPAGNCAGAGTP